MNKTQLLTAARNGLSDPSATIWSNTVLYRYLDQAIRDISEREPLECRANLAIISDTFDVDLSPLVGLVNIFEIELPVGNGSYDPVRRSGKRFGTMLKLDLATIPTITASLLTGIVTFTNGSRTVTGSGTAFSSELVAGVSGDLICPAAGGKYYQVAAVASDTSLTLMEPFEEATVTDSTGTTKKRDRYSCVRIWYGKEYLNTVGAVTLVGSGLDDITVGDTYTGTVEKEYRFKITTASTTDKFKWSNDGGVTWSSEISCSATAIVIEVGITVLWAATTSHTLNDYWLFRAKPNDMEYKHEQIAILGMVAYAAHDFVGGYSQVKLTDVSAKVVLAAAALGSVGARITQAVADIATVRVDIEADLTAFANLLADIETDLDAANTDLASGRVLIDSYNDGGDVATKYSDYARAEIANATARLDKAKSYLESAKTSKDYIDYAGTELTAAQRYIEQATGYAQLLDRQINSYQLVAAFERWAKARKSDYDNALTKLGKLDNSVRYPTVREL
jgi:hypothetical protein